MDITEKQILSHRKFLTDQCKSSTPNSINIQEEESNKKRIINANSEEMPDIKTVEIELAPKNMKNDKA